MKSSVFVVLVMCLGCATGPPRSAPTELSTVSSDSSQRDSGTACPAGIGSREGDDPIAHLFAPGGGHLLVCGSVLEHRTRTRLLATEFEIYYVVPVDDRRDFILQIEASENREILVEEAEGRITLIQGVPGMEERALFRQRIVCRDDGCLAEAVECAFQRETIGDQMTLKNEKDPTSLLGTIPGQTRLLIAALHGDRAASNLLARGSATIRDGEVVENLHRVQAIHKMSREICGAP